MRTNIQDKFFFHMLMEIKLCGEQVWQGSESTRLPRMWPEYNSWTQHHVSVEFVFGSRPCSQRFLFGYSGFPLSSKTNTSKFQFDLESVPNKYSVLNTMNK